MSEKIPRDKFRQQKTNAKKRGIAFDLTFEQWWDLWQTSGHWDERGAGKGKYCMARNGDTGPYAVGNVRITKFEDNNREQWDSPERREMQNAEMKKRWANPEFRERQIVKLKERHITPEQRAKFGAKSKEMWASPGYRERQSQRLVSEKTRAKLSAITKERHATPEYRKMQSDRMKEWHARRREHRPAGSGPWEGLS